jgi:hypothetical protein
MSAVGNFLDIVTTATSCGLWTSPSDNTDGLALPTSVTGGTSSKDSVDTEGAGKSGGVAVSCNSKAAVMKLASTLKLTRSGAMTVMPGSGIIVQSPYQNSSSISTAAVLPFEADIWQIALLVFGAPGMTEIGL